MGLQCADLFSSLADAVGLGYARVLQSAPHDPVDVATVVDAVRDAPAPRRSGWADEIRLTFLRRGKLVEIRLLRSPSLRWVFACVRPIRRRSSARSASLPGRVRSPPAERRDALPKPGVLARGWTPARVRPTGMSAAQSHRFEPMKALERALSRPYGACPPAGLDRPAFEEQPVVGVWSIPGREPRGVHPRRIRHDQVVAKKTLIIDDLTGETGARTHALRFDGTDYEIDLTDASFAELRSLLKPYLRAARQVGGDVVAGSRRGRPSAGRRGCSGGRVRSRRPTARRSGRGHGRSAWRSPSAAGCRPTCARPGRQPARRADCPCRPDRALNTH